MFLRLLLILSLLSLFQAFGAQAEEDMNGSLLIPDMEESYQYEHSVAARSTYYSGAGIDEREEKSFWRVSGDGGIIRDKLAPLNPFEKAYYAAEFKVRHEEEDFIAGRKKDDVAGNLKGQLSSERLPMLHLRAFGSAGWNEWGYPLSAGLGAKTRGMGRLFLEGWYTASTVNPKNEEAMRFLDHNWTFNLGYKLRPNLDLGALYNYYERNPEGGPDLGKKTYEGAVFWRPVQGNSVEFRAMLENYDYGKALRVKGILKQAVTKRVGMVLDAMNLHSNWNGCTEKQVGINLYRESRDKKTRLGLDHRVKLTDSPSSDLEEHRVMGTLTRKF